MIAAEKKFEHPFEFQPSCLVILSSNHIWEPEDISSGIMRRVIYLPFDNIPAMRDPDLFYLDSKSRPQGKLSESLSGFINWILANPSDNLNLFLTDILSLNTQISSSVVKDTNNLLRWASYNLLYSENSYSFVGNKKSPSDTHLYPNYLKYCMEFGFTPTSFNKFSFTLQDLCVNQLGWKGVYRKELHQGMTLTNVIINNTPNNEIVKTNNFNPIDLSYFNGFIEGNNDNITLKFKGLSNYSINPYALKPESTFKLSEYPINPYALSNSELDDNSKLNNNLLITNN